MRSSWRNAVLLMVALGAVGLMATEGRAQEVERVTLEGRVTAAEGGSVLPGVRVEVVGLERDAWTDELGRFRFSGVPVGTHTLRFHLIGRAVLERTVTVGPDASREEIALSASPVALDPVRVLMGRTRLSEGLGADEVPGSVHVIVASALEERPVVFDDVHALLREVPGVNIQEEDGYGLRPNVGLRGTGSERSSKITLMEDGVLIAPAPYAAPSAYYFPVTGRMEALEVRKGSSQIRYGPSTTGGALNLVSSAIPDDFSVLVDGAGASESTRKLRARVGDGYENAGWLVETYQLETDGFKVLDTGGSTGFDVQDYVGKVRVNTDLDAPLYQELEVKLGYYDEVSDETYLGLTQGDYLATPYRRYAGSQEDVMRADHQQVQLRHFLRLRSGVDLVTTGYRNTFARNWYKLGSVGGTSISAVLDDPDTYAAEVAILRGADSPEDALAVRANNREYVSQGVQTALGVGFDLLGRHDLEVGARYHTDEEDRFQHEDRYAMQGGRMVRTTAGTPGTQSNRVSSATALSFYAQDRIQLGRLILTPGLRYETIDFVRRDYAPGDADRESATGERTNGVSEWIPGVGASFALRPGLRLFGGVHRGFGPPGPGADQETEPESSVSYELGARFTGPTTRAQVAAFYSDYDNILGAETLSAGGEGTGDLFNGGAVRVSGLEVSASHDPLAAAATEWRLPLTVSYTLTRATFGSSFSSDFGPWGTVEEGDELPYLPRHQFFARAAAERGPWSANATATSVSAMRTVAGQGDLPREESTDAFTVFGLGASYQAAAGAEIYGAVENVFDETYLVARRPSGLRPGLPRTIQLGLRLTR